MNDLHLACGPLGEPVAVDYLRVLRSELPTVLGPELTSDRARGVLDMAMSLLDHLIARDGALHDALVHREEGSADGLKLLSQLIDAKIIEKSADHNNCEKLENSVASTIKLLPELTGKERTQAVSALQKIVQSEHQFLKAIGICEEAMVKNENSKSDEFVTVQKIEAYLQRHAVDGLPLSVVDIGSPLGGYSKDVFIVQLAGSGRPADTIVIRHDLPGGPLESSVVDEYGVLKAMHEAGIPVAQPLWVETDPSHFGGPALALEFVSGESPTDYRANIQSGDMVGHMLQLARIMAQVHRVEPAAAGITQSDISVADHIEGLLDRFEQQWMRRREVPNSVIAGGLAWMRLHIPRDDTAAVIVHGDCSLRNLLFDSGHATALLDWETWHIGDPAEDLAYCREEVEEIMPWEDFMAEYRAAGGPNISEERLQYWLLWRYLRGAITSISMLNAVSNADDQTDVKTAFGGVFFTRYCLTKVAEQMGGLLEGAR